MIYPAPPSHPDYAPMMSAILSIEPVYQLQRLIHGGGGNELADCIKGYLADTFKTAETATNKPTGAYMFALEIFVIEHFIRKTYNSKYRIPERVKIYFPRTVKINTLRNEAEPIAELWVACWLAIGQLFVHGKVQQHPAHLLFVLLLESRVTGLLTVQCVLPDDVTAGTYIAYNQKINAYLSNLDDSDSPFHAGLVATNMILCAMRDFANESNAFRKQYYNRMKTARSKLFNKLKKSQPSLCHFIEARPSRNHLHR